MNSSLGVDGSLEWHDKVLNVKLNAANPRALSEGDVSPVSLALTGDPLALDFEGSLDAGAPGATGKLTLDVPSVQRLAEWAGSPLQAQRDVFGPLDIVGDLSASPGKVTFNGMTLAFDEIEGTGNLSAALGGAVPSVKGELALGDLDLNPYLEAFGGGGEGEAQAETDAKPAAKSEGWSDEPVDLSALKKLNADLFLTTKRLKVQEIEIDDSAVGVRLNGGKLAVDLSRLTLYGGSGVAALNVDASGKVPAIAHTLKLTGLEARPFLADVADTDSLAGTAQLDVDITTKGQSQKAMVSALNGTGAFSFLEGAIYGINVAAMIRDPSSFVLDRPTEAKKTDFAKLSGTYSIVNGVVKNDALTLLSPLLRVAGAGAVNMPSRTLYYRLEPKAVATLKGQGGDGDKAGILVPVIIEGPWDNLKVRPDLEGAAKDLMKDPSKLLKGKDAGSILDLLGSGSGSGDAGSGKPDGTADDAAGSAADRLKKMFGR